MGSSSALPARRGKISAGRFDAYQRNVGVFVEWAGPSSDISTLDAPKIRAYYDWLCQQIGDNRFSPAYARSLLNAAKNFVSRVAELGLIPLPGTLRSKDFSFETRPGTSITSPGTRSTRCSPSVIGSRPGRSYSSC